MSEKKRAIVTVGVSQVRDFKPYHERFQRTLDPAAGLSCAHDVRRWVEQWPPGSPTHHQVHYAFKVHAIEDARARGFTSILWLDVSCHAVAPLEPLWQVIERDGHFLCGEPQLDPETGLVTNPPATMDRLGTWSSDHSLGCFGLSRDDAMKVTLLSGTCIGLDLEHPRSLEFLNRLRAFAVPAHFNGTHKSGLKLAREGTEPTERGRISDDPRVEGHRSDEVYMTLLARELKMTSSGEYFTGGNAERPTTVLKSGYDL